jgi:hypothetical protein
MTYRTRLCDHPYVSGDDGVCLDPLCGKVSPRWHGPYRLAIRPPPRIPPRTPWWRLLRAVVLRGLPIKLYVRRWRQLPVRQALHVVGLWSETMVQLLTPMPCPRCKKPMVGNVCKQCKDGRTAIFDRTALQITRLCAEAREPLPPLGFTVQIDGERVQLYYNSKRPRPDS